MASLIISQADRIADRAAQQKQLAKANAQLESIARQLAERDEQLASTQSSLEDARAALATESERAKKLEAALGATKEQSRHLREQLDAAAEAESRREAMHAAQLAEQQDLLHRMSALRSPTDGD